MIRLRPLRRHGEPTGFWPGMPRIGSRWRIGGDVYVLVDYQVGDGLRLQYQRLGSWEASHLIDPHADCRRKLRSLRRFRQRQEGTAIMKSWFGDLLYGVAFRAVRVPLYLLKTIRWTLLRGMRVLALSTAHVLRGPEHG